MNTYLAVAASLTVLLGLAHSGIGEVLIFRHWRTADSKHSRGANLPSRHKRIIWASWHLVSVFGWSLGAILYAFSKSNGRYPIQNFVETTILISMLIGGLLVLFSTRGKHPGWLVLFIISALVWAG